MEKDLQPVSMRTIIIIACLMTILSSIIALTAGAVGDYGLYLEQWALVVAGQDPWSPTFNGNPVPFNAYGPLHAIVGSAVAVHALLPKLIFAVCAIGTFLVLMLAATRSENVLTQKSVLLFALLLPMSPLIIVHTYAYGGNDIVCALLCVLACEFRARNMLFLAGVALGIGALMKFYPLLFAPFLCVDRDGIARIRPMFSAIIIFVVGMLFSQVLLNWDVLSAVEGGISREAKSLSILRFAQSVAENTNSAAIDQLVEFLIDKNSIFVVFSAAIVALWGWIFRVNWRIVTLIGILAVFAVYKVGHTQFFIVWSAVFAWVLAENKDTASVKVAKAFVPLLIFFWFLSLKSVVLMLAYNELPQFADTFGILDYYWRTVSSLVFWALIIYGLVKARSVIFERTPGMPALRV